MEIAIDVAGRMEFITDDELVEITPKSFRMRKRELSAANRKKMLAHKDDNNN